MMTAHYGPPPEPQTVEMTVTTNNTNSLWWYDEFGRLVQSPHRIGDAADLQDPFRIDWGRQVVSPPPTWPQPGLPVVTVPNIQPQPGMTFDELLRLVQAIQAGNLNPPAVEAPKPEEVEEEPAKPVEKKYGRVLEP